MNLLTTLGEALRPEIIEQPQVQESSEIGRLQKEVIKLQEWQESMKAVNEIIRKAKGVDCTKQIVDYWQSLGWTKLSEIQAYQLQQKDFAGRIGFPSYKLTNNNAVINNKLKRIKELSKKDILLSKGNENYPFEGGNIEINTDEDRIQIFHDVKPSQEVRNELKLGFNWSPSNGCWQRKITNNAIRDTNRLCNVQIPLMK